MDSSELIAYFVYIIPTIIVVAIYLAKHRKRDTRNLNQISDNQAAGLIEPASLHPVIDPVRCLGSAACVEACPEGNILGLIRGKAQLIRPSNCIGHGACKTSCPHEAISLVFGTEKRGVDIPNVSPTFETNVPGLFIAGELGGMGLIRNAIEQGRQAMDSIVKSKHGRATLDVVIIGAGPAGFSATLAAQQHKQKYVTVEQESLGGTVFHFPRGKIVMTQPVTLPLVGKVRFRETSKERLLEFWRDVEKKTKVKINYHERMEEIDNKGDHFVVKTTRGLYKTRHVLLTIGRRGTPRKLGVKGEELPKVVYRLIDPEQYRGQHVLIVGGGDAALEAAISIADVADTTVTLSYRSDSFSRAKPKNRQKLEQARNDGRLSIMMSSNVKEITNDNVAIEHDGKLITLRNEGVIICAGGILPTPFLKKIGIEVETKYGTV